MKFTMTSDGTWILVPAEQVDPQVTKKARVMSPRLVVALVLGLLVANDLEDQTSDLRP
jgi:hypothetical protein